MDRTEERERAATLMARIREHDEGALTELMRMLTPRLLRIAMALAGQRELAVEVTQDAFITLWDQRTTLRDDENIPGFLVRVVRYRALNARRADHRYHKALETTAHQMAIPSMMTENAAEHALDETERTRIVRQMVESLPERPRRVLVLHWFADLSYAEIASMLGVKVETVHQLMYRATTKLIERYRRP